jgi:hypothetical protein
MKLSINNENITIPDDVRIMKDGYTVDRSYILFISPSGKLKVSNKNDTWLFRYTLGLNLNYNLKTINNLIKILEKLSSSNNTYTV